MAFEVKQRQAQKGRRFTMAGPPVAHGAGSDSTKQFTQPAPADFVPGAIDIDSVGIIHQEIAPKTIALRQ